MPTQTHTLKIGDIELTTFNDGRFGLPAEYFSNIPSEISLGTKVEAGANLWTLRAGDHLFLVDTGSAEVLKQRFPDTGQAWPDLQHQHPTDIVLTHMHADHLGGFVDGTAFAGVKVHVARIEWDYWTNPALVDAVPEDMRPMVQMIQTVANGIADRVVLHDGESELAPGVNLVPLPGHTPGHSGVRVTGGDQELLIIGDAVISETLQFSNPNISYALDGNADQAIATRCDLLRDAADKGKTLAATHFAFPGIGKVEVNEDAFAFLPI